MPALALIVEGGPTCARRGSTLFARSHYQKEDLMTSEPLPILRLPKRIVRLNLPEPYTGFWVDVWINVPQRLLQDFSSIDAIKTPTAFDTLVVDHNLVDEEGIPFPKPNGGALFSALPTDVMVIIMSEVRSSFGKFLPLRTSRN